MTIAPRLDADNIVQLLTEESVGAILHNLGVEKLGPGGPYDWLIRSPYREDRHPSCSVRKDSGTWNDKANGDRGSIFHLVMRARNIDFPDALAYVAGFVQPTPSPHQATERQEVAHYDYTDERSNLDFQVVRYEPKDFRQRRPDGKGGWIWNLDGISKMLYRLPQIYAKPELTVFIPEGEEDVHALERLGLLATTNAGGAGKWQDSYNDPLKGRNVVTLPHNDEAGRKHAQLVAKHLHGVAASVKVLSLPDLPDKGDVRDWLAAGGNLAQLKRLVDTTPEWEPIPDGDAPGSESDAQDAPVEPVTLAEVEATFRRWLHLPDMTALYAVLGAVIANELSADAVWLMLVGPPGCGKTEHLNALSRLPRVFHAATVTEAGLLSGTPKREKAGDASGGLLRQIGERGTLICKDFTSVLSMHRDARAGVLAALREVYDGAWTRHLGTDGGRSLTWEGKLGLIAGVTQAIDSHHAVTGVMGERFIFFRFESSDEQASEQATRALANIGSEQVMRRELADAVRGLVAGITIHEKPLPLPDHINSGVVELAQLVARCRSSVDRAAYGREIEMIPESESPGRLARQLALLYLGMRMAGIEDGEAWKALLKVGLDSMPALRRRTLGKLAKATEPTKTGDLAKYLDYPTTTTRRTLEDLAAHHVAVRVSAGKADAWELSSWTQRRWANIHNVTVPEKSDDVFIPVLEEVSPSLIDSDNTLDDKTGKERGGQEFCRICGALLPLQHLRNLGLCWACAEEKGANQASATAA